MRLTCPNCGAQYEVPDEVIPESGRDVQCSNCGNTWFQPHPDFALDPDEDEDEDTAWDSPPEPDAAGELSADDHEPDQEPDPEDPAPARRELDPAITDVLREEAARERAARGGLETQPELGLSEQGGEVDKRAREAQARMARLRGGNPNGAAPESPPDSDEGPDPGTRRNLLPDIDEINSSLASDSTDSTALDRADLEDPVSPGPGGFRRGFRLVILLAVIILLIYVFAPQIAQYVPALKAPLAAFVEMVNAARVWLDEQITMLMGLLDAMSSQGGDAAR